MLISLATMLISPAPAPAPAQGDPVALLMVIALGLVVLVMVLRKRFGKKPSAEPAGVTVDIPAAPAATTPGTAGKLKLHDVEPKTAALVMAIVADKLGKPLNELRFISIKEVNE